MLYVKQYKRNSY